MKDTEKIKHEIYQMIAEIRQKMKTLYGLEPTKK